MEKINQNSSTRFNSRSMHAWLVGVGLISGVIYLFNFRLHRFLPGFDLISKTGIHIFLFLFLFLSGLYFIGIYLIFKHLPDTSRSKSLVITIIIFAVIFRACLVPTDPSVLSKDMYRYIWDGRVQQNGINPYLYPPTDNNLKALRDDKVYPNINRRDYPTIYPAGSQIFFRLFHALVGDSVYGFKSLMAFFDVLTLLVLLGLLRAYGFAEARLIIYAWNPLAIFEIAYSGHLEGITVFLMVLAFYLHAIKKKMLGIISLAIAGATKLYPVLLLPSLLNQGQRIKGLLTFFIAFFLLYLPFLSAGNKIIGFLPIYFKDPYESFNLGLKYLIMSAFPQLDYFLLGKVFLLALMAAGFIVFLKDKQKEQVIRHAFILMGLLLVLMPASLHAWYVVILIPFLTFYPSAAWLIFSCTVTLSYLKYVTLPMDRMPVWVLLLEYVPLFTLLTAGFIFKRYTHQNWVPILSYAHESEKFAEMQK